MPGFQCIAQSHLDTHALDRTQEREAELVMRCKPAGVKGVAGHVHFCHHIIKVHLDEGRQHEAVVQLGAPTRDRRLVGGLPETRHQRAQQELLHTAHVWVGWHLEGAQFQQTQSACGRVR